MLHRTGDCSLVSHCWWQFLLFNLCTVLSALCVPPTHPPGGEEVGGNEDGEDGMTAQQRKNKAKNERRAELKQQRAKEAKEAAKKKSNKLMEVGLGAWALCAHLFVVAQHSRRLAGKLYQSAFLPLGCLTWS